MIELATQPLASFAQETHETTQDQVERRDTGTPDLQLNEAP